MNNENEVRDLKDRVRVLERDKEELERHIKSVDKRATFAMVATIPLSALVYSEVVSKLFL